MVSNVGKLSNVSPLVILNQKNATQLIILSNFASIISQHVYIESRNTPLSPPAINFSVASVQEHSECGQYLANIWDSLTIKKNYESGIQEREKKEEVGEQKKAITFFLSYLFALWLSIC